MIYYYCEELGCCFRLNDGVLESTPMFADGTFDVDDFGPRDIGDDETCTFWNKELTIKEIEDNIIIPTIKKSEWRNKSEAA